MGEVADRRIGCGRRFFDSTPKFSLLLLALEDDDRCIKWMGHTSWPQSLYSHARPTARTCVSVCACFSTSRFHICWASLPILLCARSLSLYIPAKEAYMWPFCTHMYLSWLGRELVLLGLTPYLARTGWRRQQAWWTAWFCQSMNGISARGSTAGPHLEIWCSRWRKDAHYEFKIAPPPLELSGRVFLQKLPSHNLLNWCFCICNPPIIHLEVYFWALFETILQTQKRPQSILFPIISKFSAFPFCIFYADFNSILLYQSFHPKYSFSEWNLCFSALVWFLRGATGMYIIWRAKVLSQGGYYFEVTRPPPHLAILEAWNRFPAN